MLFGLMWEMPYLTRSAATPDCPVELIGYTEDSVSDVGHDVGPGLQNNFIRRA